MLLFHLYKKGFMDRQRVCYGGKLRQGMKKERAQQAVMSEEKFLG